VVQIDALFELFLAPDGSFVDYEGMQASPAFAGFVRSTEELQVLIYSYRSQ
jgi:hypothetical protein